MVYHDGKVSLCGFFGGVFLGIVGSVSFCVGRNCHSEVEVRGFHVDLEVDPSFVHHRSGAPFCAKKSSIGAVTSHCSFILFSFSVSASASILPLIGVQVLDDSACCDACKSCVMIFQ